jgi:cobalamin biosynthesis protein CbiG
MKKPTPTPARAELEADLHRNRAFGGGLSKAIDMALTDRELLIAALEELHQWCANNVAYFPPDYEAAEMVREHEALIAQVRG